MKTPRQGITSQLHESGLTVDQLLKIKEIRDSFYLFCRNNLYILDKDGNLVRFNPNTIQREIIDYVLLCLKEGRPIRLIILKARQEGVSTVVEALVYWWTSTHKNVRSKIVAHEMDASTNLYNMFKRYYDNSNIIFKPETKYETKKDLTFDNTEGTGLGSQIDVDSAENAEAGRSQTIQWLHGSEVAMWRDGSKLVAGLMQAVPMRPNTAIFLESTANGIGDFFHTTWEAAVAGNSVFKPFFFPWFAHEEYQLDVKEIKHRTPEELELKRIYNLTDGQLAWRREKMKEFSDDPARFAQEYPANATEAFLASGRPRFNLHALTRMEKKCTDGQQVDVLEKDGEISLKPLVGAPFRVWKQPQDGHKYVIGADVAEGVGGDFSVATIMDIDQQETAARWRGDVEPSEFGDILEQLGRLYNNALIACEINNHGLTTVQRLRDLRYSNLYRRERGLETRFEEMNGFVGWKKTRQTKPLMINDLSEAIFKGKIHDPDRIFIRECMSYVIDDRGRTNAQEGAHDDTVIATAIAMQMFEWTDVAKRRKNVKSKLPEKFMKMQQRHKKLQKSRRS